MSDARDWRVTVVVGACGGCGATLLAGAIGLWRARAGETAWIVELDQERGDLAGAWDLPPVRTLADLASVADELDEAQLDRAAHLHESGLRLLLAPPGAGGAAAWRGPADARLVGEIAAAGGHVVVDAGPGWSLALDLAAGARAGLLVVCPPTLAAARRARRLVDALGEDGARRCALVLSDAPDRGELGARALGRAVGAPVAVELPWRPREAAELAAGRWPRGRRPRLAGAVARLVGGER